MLSYPDVRDMDLAGRMDIISLEGFSVEVTSKQSKSSFVSNLIHTKDVNLLIHQWTQK